MSNKEKKESPKTPKTAWKKGVSANPNGRPKTGGRGTGRPISRLRSTLNKLKELEPEAIEVITLSLEGTEVDKSQLDSAWKVINSLISLTRGAIAEESYKIDARDAQQPDAERANGTTGATRPRMSMTLIEDE